MARISGGIAVRRRGKEKNRKAMALQDTASQGEGIVRKRNGEAWRREAVELKNVAMELRSFAVEMHRIGKAVRGIAPEKKGRALA